MCCLPVLLVSGPQGEGGSQGCIHCDTAQCAACHGMRPLCHLWVMAYKLLTVAYFGLLHSIMPPGDDHGMYHTVHTM